MAVSQKGIFMRAVACFCIVFTVKDAKCRLWDPVTFVVATFFEANELEYFGSAQNMYRVTRGVQSGATVSKVKIQRIYKDDCLFCVLRNTLGKESEKKRLQRILYIVSCHESTWKYSDVILSPSCGWYHTFRCTSRKCAAMESVRPKYRLPFRLLAAPEPRRRSPKVIPTPTIRWSTRISKYVARVVTCCGFVFFSKRDTVHSEV